MANVIKLRKGLNIHLKGTAAQTKRVVGACAEYVVRPDTFEGVVPKLVVHEGDRVEVGDVLFVDKNFPEVRFASPVSGTVKAVERGERRKTKDECEKLKTKYEKELLVFRLLRFVFKM